MPFDTKISRIVPMETSSMRAKNISSGSTTHVNTSELKNSPSM
jgi:hypothetical protein